MGDEFMHPFRDADHAVLMGYFRGCFEKGKQIYPPDNGGEIVTPEGGIAGPFTVRDIAVAIWGCDDDEDLRTLLKALEYAKLMATFTAMIDAAPHTLEYFEKTATGYNEQIKVASERMIRVLRGLPPEPGFEPFVREGPLYADYDPVAGF